MKSSLSCGNNDQAMWTTAHTQGRASPTVASQERGYFTAGADKENYPPLPTVNPAITLFLLLCVFSLSIHSLSLFLFISHFLHCIQLINQSQAQLSDKFNSAFSHKLATPLISPNLQNDTYAHISTTTPSKLTNTSCNDPGHQHKLVSFQQVSSHALYSTAFLSALN